MKPLLPGTLKYSGKKNKYQAKTAADIVQRLPLHRSMNESQAALVTLTPRWQSWLKQALNQGSISSDCAATTRLVAWQPKASTKVVSSQPISGHMIITCNNPANATLIKQQQQSILEHLNRIEPINKQLAEKAIKHSSLSVKKLVVRLEMNNQRLPLASQSDPPQGSFSSLDDNSIAAIESSIKACQNQTKNEKLANSLKNLASTISSLPRKR